METNCTIHWIEIYPVDSAVHLLNISSPRMPRHIRDLLTLQSAKFKKLPSDTVATVAEQGVRFTPSQKAKCFGG